MARPEKTCDGIHHPLDESTYQMRNTTPPGIRPSPNNPYEGGTQPNKQGPTPPHPRRDSGTDEGSVSPSFEPRPTTASDFPDESTWNSGRGAHGAMNSRGGVTSAVREGRADLDGGVVESTTAGTAAEVATEDGVDGKLADDGQEPTATLSVVGDPEVWHCYVCSRKLLSRKFGPLSQTTYPSTRRTELECVGDCLRG